MLSPLGIHPGQDVNRSFIFQRLPGPFVICLSGAQRLPFLPILPIGEIGKIGNHADPVRVNELLLALLFARLLKYCIHPGLPSLRLTACSITFFELPFSQI